MSLSEKELIKRLSIAELAFKGTKYQPILDDCIVYYNKDNLQGLQDSLDSLPTAEHLFREMLEKLSHPKPFGKPIYKTMKRIIEGKPISSAERMKAYFSFCTHVCIELEKGNGEYKLLLNHIYEKIGEAIYGQKV